MGDHLSHVSTIFRKDFKEAVRDARVLMAIVTPLVVGLLYSFLFDDTIPTPPADVVVYSAVESSLPATLMSVIGDAADVRFYVAASAEEAEGMVRTEDADVALVVPDDFDRDLKAGFDPELVIFARPERTVGANYVLTALEPAIRQVAEQSFPAQLSLQLTEIDLDSQTPIDAVGIRTYMVLFAFILTITMISMLAIPVVLAEETEKKTYDALAMIASDREIVAAKAVLGISWVALGCSILLILTRLVPERPIWFGAGIVLLSLALLGVGLLIAGIVKSPGQLNTWSGLVMLPFIAPAFLVGVGFSEQVEQVAGLLPTGAAMMLLTNSYSERQVFDQPAVAIAVLGVWAVLAFGLLQWQLSRRRN